MTKNNENLLGWTLNEWKQAYSSGQSVRQLLGDLLALIRWEIGEDARQNKGAVWIELASDEQLALQIQTLESREGATNLPLYGVPFAVKDNIDACGFSTTAACPEYSYRPDQDAEVVRRLRSAGAIVLGKTNLDQFATGLVGTRSPHGAVANAFNKDYISGGSSSGSAVAVARGFVPFALGTDTAGSGRIPAGFNHLVGLKPSKGLISTRGVIPACRSLDCVSIFTLNAQDAEQVLSIASAFDPEDAYSREAVKVQGNSLRRMAIPIDPPWFGDEQQQLAYKQACTAAVRMGYEIVAIDFSPLFELAELLYQGPWIAERYAAVGEFIEQDLPGINAVVKGIIRGGRTPSAVDAFNAEYRRMALLREIQPLFENVEALLVPTSPRFPTQAEVAADPVTVNSQLGIYTNFVNFADLCAIALPATPRGDGMPFGITVIAPAFREVALLALATHWQSAMALPNAPALLGIRADQNIVVAVVGAHLSGMPLNHQLTSRNAVLLEQTHTASKYQLYALADTVPPKPGLVRVADTGRSEDAGQGHAIVVELWRLDIAAFGSFVAEIPRPLGIGTLELADGRQVKGFICEPEAIKTAHDISTFGGWRAYITQQATQVLESQ